MIISLIIEIDGVQNKIFRRDRQRTSFYQEDLGTARNMPAPQNVTSRSDNQTAEIIASMYAQIQELTADKQLHYETAQQQLGQRLQTINKKNKEIGSLASENETLKKQIATLQSEKEGLIAQNHELRNLNSLLQSQNGSLGDMNEALNQEVYTLRQQGGLLGQQRRDEFEVLTAQRKQQADELEVLRVQRTQSQQQNVAQAEEIRRLRELVNAQSVQMAALENIIAQNSSNSSKGFQTPVTVVHVPKRTGAAPYKTLRS